MTKTFQNHFKSWFDSLPKVKANDGPAKGTIATALIVLDRLKEDYNLNLQAHRAAGEAQLKGASGAAVQKILLRFGEHRPFAKEGGRTNRGGPGQIQSMLEELKTMKLASLSPEERNSILESFQGFLVDRVRDFHNRQRLKISFDPSKTTWQLVSELLSLARETGKEGPVAQYLVGAKLQLRFPDEAIENRSFSTADDQLGLVGDFKVHDTAFHVTVAPMQGVYEKCRTNLNKGYRVYLLVPNRTLLGTRQIIDETMPGKVAVEAIESFISQNIEEIAIFSIDKLRKQFRSLLDKYNSRVDEIELDKSFLIEIPPNLES
jgi:hypothetical protein